MKRRIPNLDEYILNESKYDDAKKAMGSGTISDLPKDFPISVFT